MAGKEPVKALQPQLKSGFFNESFISLIFAFVFSSFLGIIIYTQAGLAFAVAISTFIALFTFVSLSFSGYMRLKNREYRFYDDEVEEYQGWINIKQDNISYDRVTDIAVEQPYLQRIFGTGTVKLNTAGADTHTVEMTYLEDPEQVYDELRDIVW